MNRTVSAASADLDSFYSSDAVLAIKERMIAGQSSAECKVCYYQESLGQQISNRQLYNLQLADKLDASKIAEPKYSNRLHYDLSLSNKCNQRCRICGPKFSTHWIKDADALSDLEWSHVHRQNSSAKVFSGSALMPSIIHSMRAASSSFILELKGGEPLYNDETVDLLRSMIAFGLHKNCAVLKIITNGTAYNQEMLDLLKQFPVLDLQISIDATGRLHEYTRGTGITWDECRQKWRLLITSLGLQSVVILNTIYIYNVFDQGNLRSWARSEFGSNVRFCDVLLHGPRYLSIDILPDDILTDAAATMSDDMGLKYQIQQGLSRPKHSELLDYRRKFAVYTNRLDRLRGENLVDLAPGLASMLDV